MRGNWMAVILAGVALASCQTYGNDEMARYLQRSDRVTMSGGDANSVNSAAMTLNPWPPGVGDRRIPMQGTRAATAMQAYRCDNAQKGPVQTQTQSQTRPTEGGGSATSAVSQTARAKTADGC